MLIPTYLPNLPNTLVPSRPRPLRPGGRLGYVYVIPPNVIVTIVLELGIREKAFDREVA